MDGDGWQISEVMAQREVVAALARAGHAGPFPAGWLLPRLRRAVACGTWEGEVPDGLLTALEAPGLDLAMELFLGPGSFTHVLTALEDSEE